MNKRTQEVAKMWANHQKAPIKRETKPQPVSPEREAEIERELAYQFQDDYESRN